MILRDRVLRSFCGAGFPVGDAEFAAMTWSSRAKANLGRRILAPAQIADRKDTFTAPSRRASLSPPPPPTTSRRRSAPPPLGPPRPYDLCADIYAGELRTLGIRSIDGRLYEFLCGR